MEDQAEVIRQQMQEKRAELSDKLQALGDMLPSTESVSETVESVSETAAAVSENVQDTVKTVQDALDLPKHVQEHPWLAVGGAVVVGFLTHGYLTARRTTADGKEQSIFGKQIEGLEEFAAQAAFNLVGGLVAGAATSNSGSLVQTLLQQFLHGSTDTARPRGGQSSNGTHRAGKPEPRTAEASTAR